MKKIKSTIICITVACLSLIGCSKSDTKVDINEIIKSSAAIASEETEQNENKDDFVLTIWNDALDKNNIEEVFKELYPKAQINIVSIDGADSEKISQALAAGNAPDVVMYYSNQFGKFNAIEGFEDLSQSKYNINDIKPLFSEQELDQCMSFDNKKLVALPFTASPMVTYYRSDILEQHGISTDPEELGDFMEKPEGWLTIAKELKKDNISAIQWKEEFINMVLSEQGYFDKNMNLKVDNEKIKESVEIAKETCNSALNGNYDIWFGDDGKKAIREGKIAILYMNKWGENYIKEVAPETAGKWRATRLPLGISCSDTNYISISSTSKYKMQASELVKKLVEGDRNYFESIKKQESEFLGGQEAGLIYTELANKLPIRYPTILDDKVESIFMDSVTNNVNSDINVDSFFNSTKVKISNSINHEQKVLAEYIRENRKP